MNQHQAALSKSSLINNPLSQHLQAAIKQQQQLQQQQVRYLHRSYTPTAPTAATAPTAPTAATIPNASTAPTTLTAFIPSNNFLYVPSI